MSITAFIVRHGERADDVMLAATPIERVHDPHLTAKGIRQAHVSALRMKSEASGPVVVFSSPFLRCVQTAAEIARVFDCKVKVEKGLSEFLLESWFPEDPRSNLTIHAVSEEAQVQDLRIDLDYSSRCELSYPEDITAMTDRYIHTFSTLLEMHPNDVIIAVTHGYGVQSISEHIDEDTFITELDYCGLTRISRDQSVLTIDYAADASHIETLTESDTQSLQKGEHTTDEEVPQISDTEPLVS
eukprot:GILJ01003297.1.p1 GENE.GILJ01003297.1~~GILJ01003297.1.p1  ORF type:complete len:254 (+),score=24.88 GILJ01003297.1:35-763(+)